MTLGRVAAGNLRRDLYEDSIEKWYNLMKSESSRYRPFDKTFVTIHLYVELGVHGGGLDVLGGAARVVARPPAAPRQHRPPRLLAVQRRLAHPVVGADVHQVQVRELKES